MDDNLCERLEALHRQIQAELEQVENLDANQRLELERLQADIATALERCEDEQAPALRDRLGAAVDEFEVSHPSLTTTIGQVMDFLSRSGI